MTVPTLHDPTGVAAALAARGRPIRLLTGEVIQLRYSMLSLAQLEADFGNMAAIIDHVEGAARSLAAAEKARTGQPLTDDEQRLATEQGAGRIFTMVSRVLIPGLIDAKATDPRAPEQGPQWLEGNVTLAQRVLDPALLAEYMEAFRAAFTESFDTGPQAGGAVPPTLPTLATIPPPGETVAAQVISEYMTTHPSPGPSGTTQRVVSPDALMSSSGA